MIVQSEADAERVKIAAKAEALQKMVAAAGGNPDAAYRLLFLEAYRLLFLEQMPAVTETLAGAISSIKFDKVVLWSGAGGPGANCGGVSSLVEDLVKVLPPLMQVAEEIGGVQLPGIFGKRMHETTVAAAADASAAAATLEVPVKVSMTVPAKRATD
jgi:flotillin